jgi:hypothetical protein
MKELLAKLKALMTGSEAHKSASATVGAPNSSSFVAELASLVHEGFSTLASGSTLEGAALTELQTVLEPWVEAKFEAYLAPKLTELESRLSKSFGGELAKLEQKVVDLVEAGKAPTAPAPAAPAA